MCLPILVRLISSHTHSVLKLTVTEMQNRLITDAKNLESSKTFCLKTKTLIFIFKALQDQNYVLKDNNTAVQRLHTRRCTPTKIKSDIS